MRVVATRLLCLWLSLGLILGQSASAVSVRDHHPDTAIEIAGDSGAETLPAQACHPGVACLAFVLPEGPATTLSLSIVNSLQPTLTLVKRRFVGPSVTLPPPRILI